MGACPTPDAASRSASKPARDPAKRRRVASLGLVDPAAGRRFLVDATPDFADQIESARRPPGRHPAHARAHRPLPRPRPARPRGPRRAKRSPSTALPSMAKFLRENEPWSRLVALENIAIREVAPGSEIVLTDSLRATPIRVPHRDEDSDTVAWLDPRTRALHPLAARHRQVGEVGPEPPGVARGSRARRVRRRHVLTPPTRFPAARSRTSRTRSSRKPRPSWPGCRKPADRVYLVHLNHTNRLLWDENAKAALAERGIGVAREGQRISLAGSAAPAKPPARE